MSSHLIRILALSLGLALAGCGGDSVNPGETTSSKVSRESARRAAQLQAREDEVDRTVWAKEILAQQCGRTFDALWDGLNAAADKFSVLASFPVGEVTLPVWSTAKALPHQIQLRNPSQPGRTLSKMEWTQYLEQFRRAGWQLVQTEFRHRQFDVDAAGQPARSRFQFAAHLVNETRQERAVVRGDLFVRWAPGQQHQVLVKAIDAGGVRIETRHGAPGFRPLLTETVTPPGAATWIDPLLVYDLDGDGYSEIVLLAKNLVLRRQGTNQFTSAPLCRYPPGLVFSGVLADLDGDGVVDLLCATARGLVLFKGSGHTEFEQPGQMVWEARPRLVNPMAITCGDIDGDGDLDLFLGQYRVPTLGQILRPSFYAANDGHPSHLLLNDGHGRFTDATAAAGLEKKRGRRVFSASFVDMNEDGHLDLVVASDFSGLDLYRNDGQGHFTDVTTEWVGDAQGFGMSHALADFNVDGHLDLLMIGMDSPTADRLEHLHLVRPGSGHDPAMRSRMTFGNRLLFGRVGGGFTQAEAGRSIAHSGWSWGCSAFDFDNDGFPDVYIANGHESKQSVREYEPDFWLHDIFIDESIDDISATRYLVGKYDRTRGQGWSYGGYDKNRLYLSLSGESYLDIAHLMGVALEEDSRCVVTDDLDGDGREDLLVTTMEAWPEKRQTIRIYRNQLPDTGHWIGFRLLGGPGCSSVGAKVVLESGGRRTVRHVVTGDSFRSQHADTVHFGLGQVTQVDRAEILWPNGQVTRLGSPAVDQYYSVSPSIESSGPAGR